jgi:LysR family nitrogen assimilation transcriptional regulator
MELRQLRYFKAIADSESFARGAHQLRVAQPALSRSIAKLEAEFGQKLFVRHGGGVALTEAGRLLYQHASIVLRSVQRLTTDMAADLDVPFGPAAMGAPPLFQGLLTAPVAAEFIAAYPQAKLSVAQEPSLSLHDRVQHGELDLAVVSTLVPASGLHITPLCTVSLCVVCRKEDRHRFGEHATPGDLADCPLIVGGSPTLVSAYLAELFANVAAQPNVRCEANSDALVVDLVARGAGFGIAPWGIVPASYGDQLDMVPIEAAEIALVVATSHERRGSAAVRVLSQMLFDHAERAIAMGAWRFARFDGPAKS